MIHLPDGLQFALTWSIPDNFGGMTSALLHRSRAFVRLADRPVDILTFDARDDYPQVEARLRLRGELIDGMRLVNLWDWLRVNPVPADAPGSLSLDRHVFTPLAGTAPVVTRYADDGSTVLQVDYHRSDGSLLATDRRDTREPGTLGGRSVVLCDETGEPIRSWGRVWALYRFWIDLLRQRRPSYLLVDSKTVANFAATYRRKRAVTMHIVHNSHLQGDELRQSRREVFENLGAFDSVVLLTERQRADVVSLLGPQPHLAVIPNGREVGARVPLERDVRRGIVLASLTARKRVGHAVRAVTAAGASVDIYGDGDERAALETMAGPNVVFHGYDADARLRLADASFLLSTATSEGLPLALVEAMAAGCLPIAYDVPYGPSDLIVDGRTGFLVPSGDEVALAAAIERLLSLPRRTVTRMRRAAMRAARAYSDDAVTRSWATEMRMAAYRKQVAWAVEHQTG